MEKKRKDPMEATIRARIPRHVADLICTCAEQKGMMTMTAYIRLAVLQKISSDTGKTIEEIVKG
jgi:hypothetical protein